MIMPFPSPHRLRQLAKRRIAKRLDRRVERDHLAQWFLLIGMQPQSRLQAPDPTRLAPIFPPSDRFWADPFVWRHEGRFYVFFEEYPWATQRGRISVIELGPDLQPSGDPLVVIDEPRHLSYPFLLDYEDALYLIPESARSHRIDLYRCERFPDRWRRVHSLMKGVDAADSTLFAHEGRWWLFCAMRTQRTRINESLFAFWSNSPLSTHWEAHPRNPLVKDFARARPGGRVLRDADGRLIRPGQDAVPRYGAGLGGYEIELLTPDQYRERRIWHTTADSMGWRGMHHLDWHAGCLAMDAQRLIAIPESVGQGPPRA